MLDQPFQRAARLGELDGDGRFPARFPCDFNGGAKRLGAGTASLPSLGSGYLQRNRIELLVVALGATVQHRQYLFRVRQLFELSKSPAVFCSALCDRISEQQKQKVNRNGESMAHRIVIDTMGIPREKWR